MLPGNKIAALAAFDRPQQLHQLCKLCVEPVQFVRLFGIAQDALRQPERIAGQENQNESRSGDKSRLAPASAYEGDEMGERAGVHARGLIVREIDIKIREPARD